MSGTSGALTRGGKIADRPPAGKGSFAAAGAGSALLAAALLLGTAGGCASGSPPSGEDAVLLVVGASGDGPWYDALRQALRRPAAGAAAPSRDVATFTWGLPLPLAVFNLQDRSVHERAERRLAGVIDRYAAAHPRGRLHVVAHSAGCGVILGALPRARPGAGVETLVLLAPSVSPGYDLAPAMARVRGTVHSFRSSGDTTFLRWRTATFGTYDNVRTAAAGHAGFDAHRLSPDLRQRFVEHAWTEADRTLGHDGGHFGPLARGFAEAVVAPLLRDAEPATDAASPAGGAAPR